MSSGNFLYLFHLLTLTLACILVVVVHFLAFFLDLLCNLLVNSKFTVSFSLSFASLSHQHFPASDVVHCLIFVSKKVSLDKRTVAHCDSTTVGLKRTLPADVCQGDFWRCILTVLFIGSRDCSCYSLTTDLVSLRPLWKLGWLDHHARKKLAEGIEQVALRLRFLYSVSIFGEGCFQTVIDRLR